MTQLFIYTILWPKCHSSLRFQINSVQDKHLPLPSFPFHLNESNSVDKSPDFIFTVIALLSFATVGFARG